MIHAATDIPLIDPHQTDWSILRAHPHNVLLEGPVATTDAVLLLLQPHIHETIVWNRPQSPVNLHNGQTGALILRDAAALSVDAQSQLLEWLEGAGSRAQIVSTTERSLFGLVSAGLFNTTLYYRLNIMLLHMGPKNSQDVHSPDRDGAHSRIGSGALDGSHPLR